MIGPLEGLLVSLVEGRDTTLADIAETVGAAPDHLRQMLVHLATAGYVRALDDCCAAKCAGCGTRSSCSALLGARAWALTDRGRRLAEQYRARGEGSSISGATDRRVNPLQ